MSPRGPHLPVFGLCRFSYPAEGGFQVEHDDLGTRRAYLYDPARMEERFRLFEHLCLPGIAAQTDGDFTLGIVVDECLPEAYMARLLDVTEPVPQCVVMPTPPWQNHREVMRDALTALRGGTDTACLQFRHDDDDAVNIRFVEKLREMAADCPGLLERHRIVGFDFNTGIQARIDAGGIALRRDVYPQIGLALGVHLRKGERRSIFNFSHNKLARNIPVLSDPAPDMWLRGYNDFNDSRSGKNVSREKLSPATPEDEEILRRDFALDLAALRAAV
ncbi:glycosyltransferase [Mesobacterium pallidum]|uniref:glycosyltransferase n=1 Tax=Mesobacterium pallidum TaxID=2872037 RepID=UPI001EE32987|nr:glycosyltransferase [Mesobacterium pallidum]